MSTALTNYIENGLNREEALQIFSYLNDETLSSPKLWRAASLLYPYLSIHHVYFEFETEHIGMFDVKFRDGKLSNYRPNPNIILPSKLTLYYLGVLQSKSIDVNLSRKESISQREETLREHGLELFIKDLSQLGKMGREEWPSCIPLDGIQYIFRRTDH